VIKGASWKSRYDARVKSAEKTCSLHYLGVITNETGEDWNSVDIALSTATPSLGGAPPKLYPLKVDFLENIPRSAAVSSRKRRLSIRMDMDMDRKELKREDASPQSVQPVQQLTSSVQASATSVTYHIERKVKIASDKKPHKVAVAEIPVQVEFQYIVVPSKSQHAYLKAQATNKSAFQLLDGEMNVFMDGFFITTSQLQKTAPGEDFKLYLGTDSAVKVQQKPTHKQNATQGIINKKTAVATTHVTEITNNKSFEVTVLLYQEYPFASDTQNIKIKREDPSTNAPNVEIDTSSILCFTVNIAPGKTERVKLKYSVEHPEDRAIYYVKQDGRPINY